MRRERAPLCEAVDVRGGRRGRGAGAGAGAGVAAVVVALGAIVVVAGGCVARPARSCPCRSRPVVVAGGAAAVAVLAAFSSALVQPFARLAAATASCAG